MIAIVALRNSDLKIPDEVVEEAVAFVKPLVLKDGQLRYEPIGPVPMVDVVGRT